MGLYFCKMWSFRWMDFLVFEFLVVRFSLMKIFRSKLVASLMLLASYSAVNASPAGAKAVVAQHKLEMETWAIKLKTAQSAEMMRAVLADKPDVAKYRAQMIKEIGASLSKEWTLEYSTWLLENTELGKKDTQYVMDFAMKYHLKSKGLARFCYAVVQANKPVHEKKRFIELALKNIKDPKERGIANLALAVVLRGIGDDGVINARRLNLIKNSIIASAEIELGKSTVGDIAMEEVYRIRNLSKGSIAPNFTGKDSSGIEVKLSDSREKVVMLVFWSSWDIPADMTKNMLNFMRNVEKKYAGKDFSLIGVNRDFITNLRDLEKQGLVGGRTISDPNELLFKQYRVAVPPVCFVINQKGVIQYQGELGAFATLTVDSLLAPKEAVPAKPVGAGGL